MKKVHSRFLTGMILIFAVFIVGKMIFSFANAPRIGPLGSEHTHSTWDLFIDGRNITQEVFDTPQYQLRHRFVHMEDDNLVIHKHATGITFGFFLETLGVKWDKNCLAIEQNKYCTDSYSFKFEVNGKEITDFYRYEMKDGDNLDFTLQSR